MSRENPNSFPIAPDIKLAKIAAVTSGNKDEPAIIVGEDAASGWYERDDGATVFASYGQDNIVQHWDYTEFKQAIFLAGYEPKTIEIENGGLLYRKPNEPGLWWQEGTTEFNLITKEIRQTTSLGGVAKTFKLSEQEKDALLTELEARIQIKNIMNDIKKPEDGKSENTQNTDELRQADNNDIILMQIPTLELSIEDAKKDLAEIKVSLADLASMKQGIIQNRTDVENLKVDVANAKTGVMTVRTNVSNLVGEVKSLTETSATKKELSELKAKVDELQSGIAEFSILNKKLFDIDSQMKESVKFLDDKIKTSKVVLDSKIKNVNESIEALTPRLLSPRGLGEIVEEQNEDLDPLTMSPRRATTSPANSPRLVNPVPKLSLDALSPKGAPVSARQDSARQSSARNETPRSQADVILFNSFRTDIIELQRGLKDVQQKAQEIEQIKAGRLVLVEKLKNVEAEILAAIQGLKSNVESLQQSDIRTSAAIETLKASDDNFKASNVVLKSQLHAKIEELREQMKRVEDESKAQTKDEPIKELKNSLSLFQQQITDLAVCQTADNTTISELKKAIENNAQLGQELKVLCEDLKQQIANLHQEPPKNNDSELKQLKDALVPVPNDGIETAIVELKKVDEGLQSELVNLKKVDEELQTAIVELKKVDEGLQNELVNLKKVDEERQTAIGELKKVDEGLQNELVNLKKVDEERQTAIVELKKVDEGLQSELVNLKKVDEERQTAIVELKKVDESIQNELVNLKKVDEEQQTAIVELKKVDEERQTAIVELKKVDEEQQTAIVELKKVDEERQTAIVELKKVDEERQTAIVELKKVDEEQQTAIVELKNKQASLEESHEKLLQSIKDTQTQNETAIQNIKAEMSAAPPKGEQPTLNLDVVNAILANLEKMNQDIQIKNTAIQTLSDSVSQLSSAQQIAAQIADLRNEINAGLAPLSEKLISLETKIEPLEQIKNQSDVNKAELIQLQETIKQQDIKVDEVKTLSSNTVAKLGEIETKVNVVSETIGNMIADVKEQTKLVSSESNTKVSQVEEKLIQTETALASITNETKNLKVDLDSFKETIQNGLPSSDNQFKPDLNFQKDQTTGISVPAPGLLNLVTEGVQRASVCASGLQLEVPLILKETKSYEPLQAGESLLIKKNDELVWVTKNADGTQRETSISAPKIEPVDNISLANGVTLSTQDNTESKNGSEVNNTSVLNIADTNGTLFSVGRSKIELLGGIMEKKENGLFYNGEALGGLSFPLKLSEENKIWANPLTLTSTVDKGFVFKNNESTVLCVGPNHVDVEIPLGIGVVSAENVADLMVNAAAEPQKAFLYKTKNSLMLLQGANEVNILEKYDPKIELDVEPQLFKEGTFVCYDENGNPKPILPLSSNVTFEQKLDGETNKTLLSVAEFDGNLHIVGYETVKSIVDQKEALKTTLTITIEIKAGETKVANEKRFVLDGQHHDIQCLFQKAGYAIVVTRSYKRLNFICIYETGDQLTHMIDLEYDIDQYAAVFDPNNGMFVIAGFDTENKNFTVVTITKSVTAEEHKISHTLKYNLVEGGISSQQKKLTLLTIPGGTYVVSYGSYKVPFMILSDNEITAGELYIDYQTNDCPSMIYDTEKGQIVTFEKTITNNCYIQILDILGNKLQKINTKMLSSDVVDPIQILEEGLIVYKNAEGCDVIRYFKHNGHLEFSTTIIEQFDGENIQNVSPLNGKEFALITKCKIKVLPRLTENPAEFIGVVVKKGQSSITMMVRGHILDVSDIDDLPKEYIGKKLYLTNAKKDFPANLSVDENKGVFVGKCIAKNKILLVGL